MEVEPTSDPIPHKPAPTRLKDAAEEELEKLVFGDLAGFQAGLYADKDEYSSEDENEVRLNFSKAVGEVDQLEDDQVLRILAKILPSLRRKC